jgi:predicted RNA-binding protein YlxR (DUF448 family)
VRIVRDEQARLAGRGAWLHDEPGCYDTAVQRRAIRRALRIPNGTDIEHFERGSEREQATDGARHVATTTALQETGEDRA